MSNSLLTMLWIALFFVIFPVFWIAVVWLISRVGGWSNLAQNHAARHPASGEVYAWISGKVWALSSYSNCLRVWVSERGVHVEPLSFFRFGHKPLFFAWDAINELGQNRLLFHHSSTLYLSDGQSITLYGRRLAERLAVIAPRHLNTT